MRWLAWWLLIAMAAATGCSGSPTGPVVPADPRFAITFGVTHPASMSLSEPILCPGDASTCAKGPQPQGSVTISRSTVRAYTLSPGTYRLTGVLQATTPMGASLDIRIGAVDLAAGGVHRQGQVLEVVAFTGEAVPLVHVVAEAAGGTSSSTARAPWSGEPFFV
jgi:hypothetical protein